ncbi:DUF1735 domain-containing protein [Mucilaginibacter ginsenosidivorans]|uniref:DUF1735 domain-containing protein n=1 Tax=Mucilaginibacter ginsenosidivorans TaxID=398053 RepID=A0A5B8URS3_9SPHI|nr:DUF1735 domain-containing protein [Mucilaginibacter ginsenosidivorans]QEC61592.1 DUF1735 domain-containing protein [Mucilaginibacter ginsenosidivorans]
MKKRLYFISTLLLAMTALSLSSCLKDPRYVDFSKAGNVVNMPFSGQAYFGGDAITEAPADDENGTIVRQFSVNVATANPPTTDTKVTLAVDFSLVDSYNALGGAVHYEPMPSEAYSFTTTEVTVPSGKQYAVTSVTFYKNLLDPSKSYMLPIKIASTTGGYTISGNLGVHYYHFIGNDFAGAYLWDYTRIPAAGNFVGETTTLFPVTPTQFEMNSGYFTQTIRYEVTFTKNSDGTYSDFAVDLNADDIQNILVANGLTLVKHPVLVNYDPTHKYTYDEVVHGLLKLNWTTATRDITDYFYKP